MKLLALDTSSDACSAALLSEQGCEAVFEVTPRAHTRLILPMIEQVLQRACTRLADIEGIAVGCGPGAFTGVRIAIGVAQGLALAVNKPVLPVSTLAALAEQARQQGASYARVALDARMGEVYWGEYALRGGQVQLQGVEQVCKPCDVPVTTSAGVGVGSGWAAHETVLMTRLADKVEAVYADWLPAAVYIAQLAQPAWQAGQFIDPEQLEPVYLRNKVAQTTQERAALST